MALHAPGAAPELFAAAGLTFAWMLVADGPFSLARLVAFGPHRAGLIVLAVALAAVPPLSGHLTNVSVLLPCLIAAAVLLRAGLAFRAPAPPPRIPSAPPATAPSHARTAPPHARTAPPHARTAPPFVRRSPVLARGAGRVAGHAGRAAERAAERTVDVTVPRTARLIGRAVGRSRRTPPPQRSTDTTAGH